MSASINPDIVTDGLVLCLDAGNSASYPGSGTLWTDLSGNGNNGTLTNGPTFSSNNKGGIVFDGIDDTITSGSGITIYSNFTVSIWLTHSNVTSPTNQTYFNIGSTGLGADKIVLSKKGSNIEFLLRTPPGSYWQALTSHNMTNNNFYNWVIVGSYSAHFTTMLTYKNGILVRTDGPFNLNTSESNCNYTLGSTLAGTIYNTMFYNNKALSATEILQNYNATKGRFGL